MLKSIRLVNWGPHRNSVIEILGGRIILITGRNGSGKSLILEAIRFLFGGNVKLKYKKWSGYITEGENEAYVSGNFIVDGQEMTIKRVVRRGKHGDTIKYYINDRPVSKKNALRILSKFLPDPDNPFIIADTKNLEILNIRSENISEGLLRYLERGVYIVQTIEENGKEATIRMSLEALREEIAERNKKLEEMKRGLNIIKEQLENEKLKLRELSEKMERLRRKRELEKELNALMVERRWSLIRRLKKENKKLKRKLKKLTERENLIQNELKKFEEKKSNLSREVERLEEELRRYREKLDGVKKEINNIYGSLQTNNEHLKDISDKINEIDKKLQLEENKLNEILKRHKKVESTLKSLRKQRLKLKRDKRRLENRLKKLSAFRFDLTKLERLKEERLVKKEEIKAIKNRINDLQAERAKILSERNSILREKEELEKLVSDFEIEYGLVGKSIKEKEDKINELLGELRRRYDELSTEKMMHMEEKLGIEKSIEALESEINALMVHDELLRNIVNKLREKYYVKAILFRDILGTIFGEKKNFDDIVNTFPLPELLNGIIIENEDEVGRAVLGLKAILSRMDINVYIPIIAMNCKMLKEIISEMMEEIKKHPDLYSALQDMKSITSHVDMFDESGEKFRVLIRDLWNIKMIYVPEVLPQVRASRLREKLNEMKEEVMDLEEKIREIEEAIKKLEEEEQRYRRILGNEYELERKILKLYELDMKINSIDNEIEEKKNKLRVLNKEREKIDQEIMKIHKKLPKDPEKIADELNALPRWISSRENMIKEIQAKINKAYAEYRSISEELNAQKAEIDRLKGKIESLKSERDKIINSIEEKKEKLVPLEKEQKELEAKIGKIEEEMERIRREIYQAETSDERIGLSVELSQIKDEKEKTKRRIEKNTKEIQKLLNEVKPYGEPPMPPRSIEQIDMEIAKLRAKIEEEYYDVDESIEVEFNETQSLIRRFERELNLLEQERNSLKDLIDRLKNAYISAVRTTLSALEKTINDIFLEAGIAKACRLNYIHKGDSLDSGGIAIEIFYGIDDELKKSTVKSMSSGEYTLFILGVILSLQRLNPSVIYVYDELVMHLDETNIRLAGELFKRNIRNGHTMILIIPSKISDIRSIIKYIDNYVIYMISKHKGTSHIYKFTSFEDLRKKYSK